MKRLVSIFLGLVIMLALVGCSSKEGGKKALKEEGIAPYKLSESEENVLNAYGLNTSNSQMIMFDAPQEAITLKVKVYSLDADEKWEIISDGGMSIGEEREPMDKLKGNFTMELKDNYVIEHRINCGGTATYETEEILLNKEDMATTWTFLNEFQKIEVNKEIPVALMVYTSKMSMNSYSLKDYYEPSKFEGMDFVQAVTLEFSDKLLG